MSHTTHPVTLRRATPDDALPLLRLAQLDSSAVPPAPVLLAERDDELVAARSLATGHTVANPFVPTGDVVRLLAARAAQEPAAGRTPALRGLRLAALRPG